MACAFSSCKVGEVEKKKKRRKELSPCLNPLTGQARPTGEKGGKGIGRTRAAKPSSPSYKQREKVGEGGYMEITGHTAGFLGKREGTRGDPRRHLHWLTRPFSYLGHSQ